MFCYPLGDPFFGPSLHGTLPFENRKKLDDHWQEEREWVIGLDNGKYPEYEARLNRHREASWEENYYHH